MSKLKKSEFWKFRFSRLWLVIMEFFSCEMQTWLKIGIMVGLHN